MSILSRFPQHDMYIRGTKSKAPLFYYETSFFGAVFLADYKQLRSIVPCKLNVARLTPTKGAVLIQCLQHRRSDIGSYNEIAVAPLIYPPGKLNVSPYHFRLFGDEIHCYVVALPVSTDIALWGGIDYFNFPKTIADIEFREAGDFYICTWRDKKTLDLILELEVKKMTYSTKKKRLTLHTYPIMNNQLIHSKMMIDTHSFAMKYHLPTPFKGSDVQIRFGRTTGGYHFKRLRMSDYIGYMTASTSEGVLFMPEFV